MARIGLISDTHSWLDPAVFKHFAECDEIWHAGDFGSTEVSKALSDFKPLRGVYGNIDDKDLQLLHPKDLYWNTEGLNIWMTHIGGYPDHYAPDIKKKLKAGPVPDVFICGHSHILRVMPDPSFPPMLCLNPGAAGREGFHKIRTLLRFTIEKGKISQMQAIELGKK